MTGGLGLGLELELEPAPPPACVATAVMETGVEDGGLVMLFIIKGCAPGVEPEEQIMSETEFSPMKVAQ